MSRFRPSTDLGAMFAELVEEAEAAEAAALPRGQCGKKFLAKYKEHGLKDSSWRAGSDPDYARYRREVLRAQDKLETLRTEAKNREASIADDRVINIGAWSLGLPQRLPFLPFLLIYIILKGLGLGLGLHPLSYVWFVLAWLAYPWVVLPTIQVTLILRERSSYRLAVSNLLAEVDQAGDRLPSVLPLEAQAPRRFPPASEQP